MIDLIAVSRKVYDSLGYCDAAVRALAKELRRNKGLLSATVTWAARELLRERMRAVRQVISGAVVPGAPRTACEQRVGEGSATDAEFEEVLRNRPRAADWPLRDGTPLINATWAQLREQVEYQGRCVTGNYKQWAWMTHVLKRERPGTEHIKEVLTAEQIQCMHDAAPSITPEDIEARVGVA
jgi:hypothetical protein